MVSARDSYGSNADHCKRRSQDHHGNHHHDRDSSIGKPPLRRSRCLLDQWPCARGTLPRLIYGVRGVEYWDSHRAHLASPSGEASNSRSIERTFDLYRISIPMPRSLAQAFEGVSQMSETSTSDTFVLN